MDTKFIAKILPTKKNGKRSIGTGYLIANDLILTARHVVVFADRDNDKQIEIEWPDLKGADGKPFTSKVSVIVFDGGDDYDIAILRCNPIPQIDISLVQLAQHFPVAHEQWSGFGYPQIGKNEETGLRKKISVLGKFHPADKANHEINLTSESDALEKEGWCGLSGAPVFHDNTLYAVISATPGNRGECFTAVLIPWLLKNNTAFCELLKQPIEKAIEAQKRKIQSTVKSKIERILTNWCISESHLIAELEMDSNKTREDIVKYLVEDNSVEQSIAMLTSVLITHENYWTSKPQQWEKCLHDAEQICGWLLINSIDPIWWYHNEQKLNQLTSQKITNYFILDDPDYIEIIISRSCLQPAQYRLDDMGKAKPSCQQIKDELMFDAISDNAIDTQLLSILYKDLHPGSTQIPESSRELLDSIKRRARAKFNIHKKNIYYLVGQEHLLLLQQRDWFAQAQNELSGYLQFISCDRKKQPDDDNPCTEDQTQLLEQFAVLLEMNKQETPP